MNTTKQRFFDECVARYNDVKERWGTVPTHVWADAFNRYYNSHTRASQRDAMDFVDNLLVNNAIYKDGCYPFMAYYKDEKNEDIWHVRSLDRRYHDVELGIIDTSKPLRKTIIDINA